MAKINSEVESNQRGNTRVVVSFPDKLELSLVQANELKHYELFQWLVTILLPIAIGFWTAYFTLERKFAPLFWSALVFTAISGLFIGLAYRSRKRVFQGSISKSIDLGELK